MNDTTAPSVDQATTLPSRLARAALRYAKNGWPVLALVPHDKLPLIPKREGGSGYLDATTNMSRIQELWQREPNANIGFRPGSDSGILVTDIDGPVGETAAQRLGLLSEPTLTCRTGRIDGGRHLYFRYPGVALFSGEITRGLEARAGVGYVVLPPSVHPTGARYRWDSTSGREIRALPPKALAELRRLAVEQDRSEVRAPLNHADLIAGVTEGQRHTTFLRWIGRWIAKGVPSAEVAAVALAVNDRYGQPPEDDRAVLKMVEDVAAKEAAKAATTTSILPLNEWRRQRHSRRAS